MQNIRNKHLWLSIKIFYKYTSFVAEILRVWVHLYRGQPIGDGPTVLDGPDALEASLILAKVGYMDTFFNAFKFNLKYSNVITGIRNSGSTWYGASNLLIVLAKTTLKVMRYLHTQDFKEFDICCSNIYGWNYWHWPVLALYGMHITINQLGPENVQLSKVSRNHNKCYQFSLVLCTT